MNENNFFSEKCWYTRSYFGVFRALFFKEKFGNLIQILTPQITWNFQLISTRTKQSIEWKISLDWVPLDKFPLVIISSIKSLTIDFLSNCTIVRKTQLKRECVLLPLTICLNFPINNISFLASMPFQISLCEHRCVNEKSNQIIVRY
jgi:hypothetical protein